MFNISNYLSKFKHILTSEQIQKGVVVSVIKEVCGIELNKDSVSVKNGVVSVSGSQALKSALFIQKENILRRLKDVSDGRIVDIR